MNEPKRHHFVPRFYLANWCESDGMIPFSMRKKDESILQSRVSPSATAFENQLYSFKKVPDGQRQAIEKLFFSAEVDDKAASIYPKIMTGDLANLSVAERIIWTRFLIASRLRVPEIVNNLKTGAAKELRQNLTEDHEEFLAIRCDVDDTTLLAWTERNFVGLVDNFGMTILPEIITDPEHTKIIANMHWWIEDVSRANVWLLTSDRPRQTCHHWAIKNLWAKPNSRSSAVAWSAWRWPLGSSARAPGSRCSTRAMWPIGPRAATSG